MLCHLSRNDKISTEARFLEAASEGLEKTPRFRRAEVWTDVVLIATVIGNSLREFSKEDRRRANERAQDYRRNEGRLEKRKADGSRIWMVVPHPFASSAHQTVAVANVVGYLYDPFSCLVNIELAWARDNEHRDVSEDVELLIIQAWRTVVEGDLLGFVFGAVESRRRQPIVGELLILLTQLLDDLPTDIILHCDENPAPHTLSRSLTPYLQWSAYLEGQWENSGYLSHTKFLNPRGVIDVIFFQGRTVSEEEEEEKEEEEEEETSEEEEDYSEHSEQESGTVNEEEEEEEEEEERVNKEEGAIQREQQREDPAVVERRRAEIAEGKRPLEQTVGADLPIPDDRTRDPGLFIPISLLPSPMAVATSPTSIAPSGTKSFRRR
ncbi:hypothetical protein CBR_g19497 [Chara braunii]|uniref:Uncharacterized protein n=1 Tax=Chara braunii TaxID=69332 RepID=A0A388KY51_CHABU|nr:hypothetical protein CBR_g19497 [Chara braunii]|eukprot:GBG74984.1 hypothetical protein CBR_g19497 [Chara braunii]